MPNYTCPAVLAQYYGRGALGGDTVGGWWEGSQVGFLGWISRNCFTTICQKYLYNCLPEISLQFFSILGSLALIKPYNGAENMLKKRSLDLSEVCTEKALKKRPPPLQLLGAESWQVGLFPSLMTQDLCLGILPFLSAKDVEKFGCVHSMTHKFFQQFLNMRGKCMLIEVRMLIDISDILGNVTDKLVRVYHEDFFKAVWDSGLQRWSQSCIVSFSPSTTKS